MKDYLKYASLGFEILAAMGICAGGGYLLDKNLGTAPWLVLVGSLLGCVISLVRMIKIK